MPLEPVPEMMSHARMGGYAVGYFESWDIASLQGAIDAAEQERAPIIVGFNGEFLSRPEREAGERLEWYAALGRAAVESAKVPCGFILNECPRDDWVRRAVELGFNLVMPAGPDAADIAGITAFAHEHGAAVEAEVDELPYGAGDEAQRGGSMSDPDALSEFVRRTGVDLLAISVGNVHVLARGEKDLDLDRLARIREKVDVPLVLHGGTGISADSLRGAVEIGVTKVNYGTYLKQRYLSALRTALARDEADPHRLLGYGGEEDVLVAGRRAFRDGVLERIGLLGCCGKA